jgi:Pentapeptide repeats (9 copies)
VVYCRLWVICVLIFEINFATSLVFSRFYGLTLWFPEYIRTLRDLQYSSRAKLVPDKVYSNITFNKSLENMIFAGSTFVSCRFEHLTLSHVLFENCTMDGCTFANVRSSRTLFRDTEIMRSHFVDTDLWWGNLPYRVCSTNIFIFFKHKLKSKIELK